LSYGRKYTQQPTQIIALMESLIMPSKFEKLLDYIVNEDTDKAKDLFHEIVVEKSRKIYENLMSDEMTEEDDMYEDDMEPVEESEEEMMGFKRPGYELGGDPADDFVDDVVDTDSMGDGSESDFGDEDRSAPATKDDIMDIADALEDLKAEFEALLSKSDNTGSEDDFEGDDDEGSEDDFEGDDGFDAEADEFGADEDEIDVLREYRELVAKVQNTEQNGNHRSPINANPANRPSGGKVSASNIAQSKTDGTPPKPKVSGEKYTKGNILNVDGKETDGYKGKAPAVYKKENGANTKPVLPK